MTVKGNISVYAWMKTRQIIMEKQVKNMSYCQVSPFPNLSFSPIPLLILYSFSIVFLYFFTVYKKTCFHKFWNAFHNSSLLNPFGGAFFLTYAAGERTQIQGHSKWPNFITWRSRFAFQRVMLSPSQKVTNCRIARFLPWPSPENEHYAPENWWLEDEIVLKIGYN